MTTNIIIYIVQCRKRPFLNRQNFQHSEFSYGHLYQTAAIQRMNEKLDKSPYQKFENSEINRIVTIFTANLIGRDSQELSISGQTPGV